MSASGTDNDGSIKKMLLRMVRPIGKFDKSTIYRFVISLGTGYHGPNHSIF
jgi:hypothetical protein